MKPLNIPVEEFLRPFFNADENVCIRVFSDRKEQGFKGQKLQVNMGRIETILPLLADHNIKNRGVFFVVNYGGQEDREITRVNAQFVENDNLPVEEQYKRLMDFPLEPSLIVRTKKSLHSYWLIKDGEVSSFRKVQMKLAKLFEGDRTIINESRVLRLPGFNHCKGEPVKVQCIKYSPELRYTQEELLKYLGNTEEERKPKIKGDKSGIDLVVKGCDFIKYCREKAASLSEPEWYALITNLSAFEGGNEIIHELSKPYPKYSEAETEDKVQHFFKSGSKPITCKTIWERGFNCPKLQQGCCRCKSPSGLAYIPPDVDSLFEYLKEEEVDRSITKNVTKASEFIEKYMGRVDEVIATAFISSEIKKHFDLKETYVKTLMKSYKELHVKYKEDKIRGEEGEVLPSWYEPTEKGMRFIPGILATHMSQAVHGFYGAEDFYIYDKGVYRAAAELEAARLVRQHLIDRYTTLNNIKDVLGQWQMLIYKPVNALNPNPFIINVKNGLYNLLEDKLKSHSEDYFSTVQINANYNPEASCPAFMKFLEDCLGVEEINIVQEILGYLLIPVNKAQKSFVFVGAGNAGKSTLLSTAQEVLLGSDNVSNVPWQALGDRFKTAELFGKLANIFADLPSKSIDDNGVFKSITGEDFITVEKKNKTPFSFKPCSRLLFSCNDIPKNYGDKSNAFYRRLIIIRFERPVPAEKRDVNLKDKLMREADGIFIWALEGLKRLIKNDFNFSESEKTREELDRYRTECNSILSFIQDCCIAEEDRVTELKEMYRVYKLYCEESGLNPVSLKRFSKELQEGLEGKIRVSKDSVSRRVIFEGIGVA
jgi:putative DNA primase/helicase